MTSLLARPSAVFLSETRLATLKHCVLNQAEPTTPAFLNLEREAKAQLTRQPHAVATWYVPEYYRDGEGHTKAKAGLQDDANAAYTLALYYRMTGEDRCAGAAALLIDAWATQVQTLRTDADSGLSFSYHFPALIIAADLIKDFAAWPGERQDIFRQFVRQKALPLNTMQRANNWGNWGLVLVMSAAVYLGDDSLFQRGIERWKEFIETQIADDGHLTHEVTRNHGVGERGLWYSHFSLMPQTIAAEIARVNGVDLFDYSPGGRSLRLAFERLAPWARNPATFPYFKGGPEERQLGTGYISYFEILNAHWPNPDATAMLEEMRPLSANHSTPHLTFTHGDTLTDDGK